MTDQTAISPAPEAPAVSSWYYSINGRQNGPVTDDGVRQLYRDGYLPASTLFWQAGLEGWVSWEEFMRVSSRQPPFDIADYARQKGYKVPEPVGQSVVSDDFWADEILSEGGATCMQCGGNFPLEEFVEIDGKRLCITCETTLQITVTSPKKKTNKIGDKKKTVKIEERSKTISIEDKKKTVKIERTVLEKVTRSQSPHRRKSPTDLLAHLTHGDEVARLSEEIEVELPAVPQRLVAKLIDWAPPLFVALGAYISMPGNVGLPLHLALTLVVFLLANILLVALSCLVVKETPGKLIMGLSTIDADGDRATWLRQTARATMEQLGLLAAGFGYAVAMTNDMRQCMHDQVCQTIVAKR